MNTPVNFKIAKLLKEKEYKTETCYKGWHGDFGDLKGDSYHFFRNIHFSWKSFNKKYRRTSN